MTDRTYREYLYSGDKERAELAVVSSDTRVVGRPSVQTVNSVKPDRAQMKLSTTAENAVAQAIYGEVPVSGTVAAWGTHSSGDLIVLCVWGMGEVFQIPKVWVNDELYDENVTWRVRHYRGNASQGVDSWLSDVADLSPYTDNLVYLKPVGRVGLCYSVFRFASGDIDDVPKCQAIVQGALCYDPDSTSPGDPFYDHLGFRFQWIGADSTAPTDLDAGPNAKTLTYAGGATITSNQLEGDGSGKRASITDSPEVRFGTGKWSVEVVATPGSVTGIDYLVTKGNGTTRGFELYRDGDDLKIDLSSNGTTVDIGTLTATNVLTVDEEFTVCVEFTGFEYQLFFNGGWRQRISSTAIVHDSSVAWEFMSRNGGNTWNGFLRCVRQVVGYVRYGGIHTVGTGGFPDAGTERPGYVYTDNSALCAAEFAMNPFYGYGFPPDKVFGLTECKAWADSLLNGSVPRSRLALTLSTPKKADLWSEILCSYADIFSAIDGDCITYIPDRPVTLEFPAGPDYMRNGSMATDASVDWDYDPTEFSYVTLGGSSFLASSGTQLTEISFSQEITGLTVGDNYSIKLNLLWISAVGEVFVKVGGVVIFSRESTGVFTLLTEYIPYVATASEVTIEFTVSDDAQVWTNDLFFRDLFWIENSCVEGSLSIRGEDDTNSPNRVNQVYRVKKTDSPNWPEKSLSYTLPDAQIGGVPLVETTISMEGIFREEEAENKAASRALKMSKRKNIQWVSTDRGIAYRRGLPVEIRNPAEGISLIRCLVMQVKMIEPGRYQVSGVNYDPLHSPNELSAPPQVGVIPEGLILPLQQNSDVPSGYELWTDADGDFPVGIDPDVTAYDTIGKTGGSANFAGDFDGVTGSGGSHDPSTKPEFLVRTRVANAGTTTGTPQVYTADSGSKGSHVHDYTIPFNGVFGTIKRRNNRLVRKISGDGSKLPKELLVFANQILEVAGLSRSTAYGGRVLRASATDNSFGQQFNTLNFTTASADDSHTHGSKTNIQGDNGLVFVDPFYENTESGGGAHTHEVSGSFRVRPYSMRLPLFGGSKDVDVVQGMIGMWAGSLSAIPVGYSLCFGQLGTPNMKRRFIEIAGEGKEFTTFGDNDVIYRASVAPHATHEHHSGARDTTGTANPGVVAAAHDSARGSDHPDIEVTFDHTPNFYVVAWIMYNPLPDISPSDYTLLLGGGGTDGSQVIVDSSANALTPDDQSGVEYDDENWTQFALSSLKLTGTTSRLEYDGLLAEDRFTIEWFGEFQSLASEQVLFSNERGASVAGKDYIEIRVTTGGDLILAYNGVDRISGTSLVTAGTPYYVSLVWDGVQLRLYYGDVSSGTASLASGAGYSPTTPDLHTDLTLFNNNANDAGYSGWFEELRLVNQAPLYYDSVYVLPVSQFER